MSTGPGEDQDNSAPEVAPAAYRVADDAGQGVAGAAGSSQQRSGTDGSGKRRKLEYPPLPEPLPVPVIDNHTHLDFRDGLVEVSVTDALDTAAEAAVMAAVQVGCDIASSRFVIEAVETDHRLLGAVAIHPNDAPRLVSRQGRAALEEALAEIEQLAGHPRVRAIGETGLDYFRTEPELRSEQHFSFRRHIDIAKRLGLALQIHDRDAHDDVVRILEEEGAPEKVVFHCFSGDAGLARICNERGWYMSFSGTVTFKNADHLRAALSIAEPELLLVETDAPFLTPHPFRGRPNASYLLPHTVRAMAQHRAADLAEFADSLRRNTETVYGSWA
ncbi:TatD family hydrolase [Acaricomes phytoseiuli]|uniref:TatD family hydrolase n=1 Tax=Acaricomes phytoseiuli TaxID=291968 RepID=UPI00036AAE29|nr:TatD family hydrolase [Acaricomes phytoseiuli]